MKGKVEISWAGPTWPPSLLAGPAWLESPRQQGCYCYGGGAVGGEAQQGNRAGERFYMLNMDTHGGTHTCTHTTHIHVRRGPGQQALKPSATHFKMGTLRPREKPPRTPRPNTKARASAPLDVPGWAHQLMQGHRGPEQSRCRAHSLPGRQTLQPKEDAGATPQPHSQVWGLAADAPPLVRYSFPYS